MKKIKDMTTQEKIELIMDIVNDCEQRTSCNECPYYEEDNMGDFACKVSTIILLKDSMINRLKRREKNEIV